MATMIAAAAGATEAGRILVKDEHRCKICMGILIEPVVFPCDPRHCVCAACFKDVEEKANLECPFCRKRLNLWVRRNKGKLVDVKLWGVIRELYPAQVAAELEGQTLDDDNFAQAGARVVPNIAAEGEVRAEYLNSLDQFASTRKRDREDELAASAPLLEQFEKEWEQQHQQRAQLAKQAAADEAFARKLQEDASAASQKKGHGADTDGHDTAEAEAAAATAAAGAGSGDQGAAAVEGRAEPAGPAGNGYAPHSGGGSPVQAPALQPTVGRSCTRRAARFGGAALCSRSR